MLVHGFASNKDVNWVNPSWVSTLTRAGRRVIALDNRGHGQSSKLYDTAAYGAPMMAEDVRALLDHLQLERADVMGYSMGARITAFLAVNHPARVRSAIIGGLGIKLVDGHDRRHDRASSSRRWRRPRSPMSPIRPAAPSAASPSRPSRTSRRLPPAWPARARN